MNLDDAQKRQVASWIADGLKLADIQRRLDKELGVQLTYMDVRLLVDDLKLVPKDPERPKTVGVGEVGGAKSAGASLVGSGQPAPAGVGAPIPPDEMGVSAVKVAVDQLARPGALVSGKVTFSDGKEADWHLDQMGRLGVVPKEKGYKPSAMDVQEFQYELQGHLAKLGF